LGASTSDDPLTALVSVGRPRGLFVAAAVLDNFNLLRRIPDS